MPYVWVEMKSSGRPSARQCSSRSSTQPAAAVAGPPTRKPGVDRLDGPDAGVVQREVVRLAGRPEDAQVRLVPDLERPAAHLVAAVPVGEVRDEVADERRPALHVARRRDDADVVEDADVRIAREVARHERQLDDGPQAGLEQAVDDVVDAA